MRYDLSGVPLPFASEGVYKKLWVSEKDIKPVPGAKVVATGGKESINAQGGGEEGRRVYDPSVVPPCEACGSPRVFEMQVMPNLINVFREARKAQSKAKTKTQTDEERRAEVARLLRGEEVAEEEGDMEWGTILVFSCVKDCCRVGAAGDGKEWTDTQAAWKAEHVLVQWDT